MKNIFISDVTMKYVGKQSSAPLSFREKIELAKLLDRLGLSVIEAEPITNVRTDSLLIKSIASALKNSILAVPVSVTDSDSPAVTWNALKEAKSARLQVPVSVSAVQMEYFYRKKPAAVLDMIRASVEACSRLCPDVEFIAEDAGRSEAEFLAQAIYAAVESGAKTITVCDTAGTMLPDEFYRSVKGIREAIPENIRMGVSCSNNMYLADACAMSAVQAGVDEVKVTACGNETTSVEKFAQMIRVRGESCGFTCDLRTTEIKRSVNQIRWMCESEEASSSPFDVGVKEESNDFFLNIHDAPSAVKETIFKLGYELSDEDMTRVYEAFIAIASKKEKISAKELDAIVASAALQVPPTYILESYVTNSSNILTATAHIRLKKDNTILEGLCLGDGPIDAAFLAIEQIVGCHYELDDFQIQSVTEGREAMGETIIRLRSQGKIYSGRGISTDIIGSSIKAYVNAVNKIVYEEAEE